MPYYSSFLVYLACCCSKLRESLRDLLQVMLLSDGSVTRHLQLLTDLPVQVVSRIRAMHGIDLLPGYICQQSCHMRI